MKNKTMFILKRTYELMVNFNIIPALQLIMDKRLILKLHIK
jgi:hypothetical protein